MRSTDPIEIADTELDFIQVLARFGVDCPRPDPHGSIKIHCLFGFEHSDGGMERALRVYGRDRPKGNSGWCFAGHGFLTSSVVGSKLWEVTRTEAAKRLLDEAEVSWRREWKDVVGFEPTPSVSKPALAEALKVRLRRRGVSTWDAPEAVQVELAKCLALLAHVHDDEGAGKWLEASWTHMIGILDE